MSYLGTSPTAPLLYADMQKLVVVTVLALLLTGCMSFDKGGTRHYICFGVGIVSVNTNNPTATVVKSTTVGIGASSLPMSRCTVGFSESVAVMLQTNQPVVIEVEQAPGKPFRVETK